MSDDTRQTIVAATNELWRRQGYNATGMSEISRMSGATTGSIYHFFPGGKAELARAVIAETGAAYGDLFELILSDFDDLADGVDGFFVAAAEALEADDFIDLCPIGTVAREVASTDASLREATNLVFGDWARRFSDRLVAEGIEVTEAEAVSAALIGLVEGGFVLARVRRDASLLHSFGAQARRLVEACRRGASATS